MAQEEGTQSGRHPWRYARPKSLSPPALPLEAQQ
jgi:hypothetical protein